MVSAESSSKYPSDEAQERRLRSAYSDRAELTWRERLSVMWRSDEFGKASPELTEVQTSVVVSVLAGSVIGAYVDSKQTFQNFVSANKQTMFAHPFEAQRAVSDAMLISYCKGGWRLGWRFGLLTFVFVSVSQSLTAIRGWINPADSMLAGALMGSSYRLYSGGLRGAAVGGMVGGVLGLTSGCATWSAQKLSGETIEEKWARKFNAAEEIHSRRLEKLRREQEGKVKTWTEADKDPLANGEDLSSKWAKSRRWLAETFAAGVNKKSIVEKSDD